MFVAVAPCTFFLIRVRPEDKGLEPYGGRAQGGASEVYGMTYAEAAGTSGSGCCCSRL